MDASIWIDAIGPFPFRGVIEGILGRDIDDAGDDLVVMGQSDVGAEFAIAVDELFGAIDWVDDEDVSFAKTLLGVKSVA